MMGRNAVSRILRGAATLAAAAMALTACAGLPTSGDVNVGLELGQSSEDTDFLPLASGPAPGAGPQEIVEGFMEAAITPADNWEIARRFLTPELQRSWRPATGVSVDTSAIDRTVTSSLDDVQPEEAEEADDAEVQVQLDQLASVDASGEYSESQGPSNVAFTLQRNDAGEWRISHAPDGVVIDQDRFSTVFEGYPLQYFDSTWSRLVPDVRWFPRRSSIATTVAQALIGGSPSAWLDPAVQTAFPADVQLAQDAVPISANQVAEVALTRPAASLDGTTLMRMRTQLQATFEASGVRVSQVRFTVDGRNLEAGVYDVEKPVEDPNPLVLVDDAFGAITGDDVVPVGGLSEQIVGIPSTIESIDVAADNGRAALKLDDGHVYLATDTEVTELDLRAGLITPSLDPYGFTWSVPSDDPSGLIAWSADVSRNDIDNAWPEASSIQQLRVSAEGARVAAVVDSGGQRWLAVAAIIRDENGTPTELGPVKQLTRVDGEAKGLVWVGDSRVGVLAGGDSPDVITQMVGGVGFEEVGPPGATALAGARSSIGVRILDGSGSLFAHAGSAWREVATGVRILATRAGQ